ncbi:PadR family transcriptional regulator [Sulfolobus sp. A20]|uniref:PadR family transcriptional regulator n=1 Tax=Sulfolobaceae TaxID=118883 RepID=UPI000845F7BA|nr:MULTISPECIES: PadR family transcriptional regulator [unclassified Sulfolobus]TRM75296.1 PadR family transcriptional regulator [Sulfolobus sp. A20-N-F8]TRM76311.1 PadR family transcriptional regulator [Sulfolobus sp. B5]TRM80535.1 PadR family transcriptional regulator [Sulfolobus sp. D5]TRM81168.1 PadR family transcriptional regulator [Sulfolobus sp. A20-N-F6]TRM84455.1 PadR family transcriptional regulator [Sulfolobus sp. F3]TRM87241.1 PadR family transcriptional regulator [Sulfolobus sp. 
MRKRTERILRGVITLYILKSLNDGPKNGYELEKIINSKLNYELPDGSIYVLLKYMARKQLIKYEELKNSKGQTVKRYYITDKGISFLKSHEKPLMAVRNVIDELIETINKLNG